MSFFFGIFMQTATKGEQEIQYSTSQIIPITYDTIPRRISFFRTDISGQSYLLFLLYRAKIQCGDLCQLDETLRRYKQ